MKRVTSTDPSEPEGVAGHRSAAHAWRPRRKESVVAVLRRGECLLVIKRAAGVSLPGYWTPPSGTIEPGETQEVALVREMEEELGIRVVPTAKVWECSTDDGFLLHWWTADTDSRELRPDPGEVEDVRWVTRDEYPRLEPTFAGDRDFVAHVLPTLYPAGPKPGKRKP